VELEEGEQFVPALLETADHPGAGSLHFRSNAV
jgi:hypothetical protein